MYCMFTDQGSPGFYFKQIIDRFLERPVISQNFREMYVTEVFFSIRMTSFR